MAQRFLPIGHLSPDFACGIFCHWKWFLVSLGRLIDLFLYYIESQKGFPTQKSESHPSFLRKINRPICYTQLCNPLGFVPLLPGVPSLIPKIQFHSGYAWRPVQRGLTKKGRTPPDPIPGDGQHYSLACSHRLNERGGREKVSSALSHDDNENNQESGRGLFILSPNYSHHLSYKQNEYSSPIPSAEPDPTNSRRCGTGVGLSLHL